MDDEPPPKRRIDMEEKLSAPKLSPLESKVLDAEFSDTNTMSEPNSPPENATNRSVETEPQPEYQSIQDILQSQSVINLLEKLRREKSISSSSSSSEEKIDFSSVPEDVFSSVIQMGNIADIPLPEHKNRYRRKSVIKGWKRFCKILEDAGLPPPAIKPDGLMRFLTSKLQESEFQICYEQHIKRQKMMEEYSIKQPNTEKEIWDRFNTQKVPGKFRRNFLVNELLQGALGQCKVCSYKFENSNSQEFKDHMDEHFRERLRESPSFNEPRIAPVSAPWYPSGNGWLREKKVEEKPTIGERNVLASEVKRLGKRCRVCHEDFEQFFDEKEEAWKLKNSMRHSGKVIHNYCLPDFERSIFKTREEAPPPTSEDIITLD